MRSNKGSVIKKTDLPEKICAQCRRPFSWRKKWERCWQEVRFCSDRCKRDAKTKNQCAAASVEDEFI
ncbi:MAG: DUF2256 domain-containing protein [Oleibacter sp.]|nr:DUF2256 domain-containing protein [Thalassolituus sp.]